MNVAQIREKIRLLMRIRDGIECEHAAIQSEIDELELTSIRLQQDMPTVSTGISGIVRQKQNQRI